MTPKSEEEIKRNISGASPQRKLEIGVEQRLIWAIESALTEFKAILSTEPIKASEFDFGAPLRQSVYINDYEIVEMILSTMTEVYNSTPYTLSVKSHIEYQYSASLTKAIQGGNVEMIELFLSQDIDGVKKEHLEDAANEVNKPKIGYSSEEPLEETDERNIQETENRKEIVRMLYNDKRIKNKLDRRDKEYYGVVMNEGVRDKMIPKSEEQLTQAKKDIIKYITNIVELNGGRITMKDLEADTSPVYDVDVNDAEEPLKDIIHLIEALYEDEVEVEEYDNWAEAVISEYMVKYTDLSSDTLVEIKGLLQDGIEFGQLNEGVRDKMTPKSEQDIKSALTTTQTILKDMYDDDLGMKIFDLLYNAFDEDENKFLEFILEYFPDVHSYIMSYSNARDYDYGLILATVIDKMDREQLLKFYELIIDKKLYESVTNESVRDMMRPKSKEDMRKAIDNLVPGEKLKKGMEMGLLTKAEARDMIDRLSPEFKLIYGKKYDLLSPREMHELFLPLPLSEKIRFMRQNHYKYSADKLKEEFLTLSKQEKEEIIQYGIASSLLPDNNLLQHTFRFFQNYDRNLIEKFDMMLKRLRKVSSNMIKKSKRWGRNNVVYVNEGVRDKMTPKSIEDITNNLVDKIYNRYTGKVVSLSNEQGIPKIYYIYNDTQVFDKMMKFGNGIYIHMMNNKYYLELKQYCWEKNIAFTQITSTEYKIMSHDKIKLVLHKLVLDVLNGRNGSFMITKFTNLMR